ncbi:MAG: Integrase core domain [Verrucomicrobiales bacterium]|nr:Integrase core domain [Verrucomicrobiales bacterium]
MTKHTESKPATSTASAPQGRRFDETFKPDAVQLREQTGRLRPGGTGPWVSATSSATMESFWASLKAEALHRVPATRSEAGLMIHDCIDAFHNTRRLHSLSAFHSPIAFEQSFIQHLNQVYTILSTFDRGHGWQGKDIKLPHGDHRALPGRTAGGLEAGKRRGAGLRLNGQRRWDRTIKSAGWRGQLHWNPKPAPNTRAPPWPANAMRHSFVSYHVAAFGDQARTAMEFGHSVEVRQPAGCHKAWFR